MINILLCPDSTCLIGSGRSVLGCGSRAGVDTIHRPAPTGFPQAWGATQLVAGTFCTSLLQVCYMIIVDAKSDKI